MKIAIIGAGASGLAVLQALTSKDSDLTDVTVYEKATEVGGLWNYGPTGPVYDHLKTNIPKEIMSYPDLPFDSSIKESFIGHSDVLNYLKNYANEFNLLQYIKFRHSVKWIDPVDSNNSLTLWNVTVVDEEQNEEITDVFDSVVLCNGNFNNPIAPYYPGLKEFDGEVLHSISYRSSDKYRDKVVLVVGAAYSGQDIAHETARFAKKVIVSHSGNLIIKEIPNFLQAPRIKYIDDDRKTVVFQDDTTCQPDVIIFATGYARNFQFCSNRCELSTNGRLYYPLYKHMIHAKFHRLFVIALCDQIIPFPFAYIQGQLVKSLLKGKCTLPSSEEMLHEIENDKHKILELEGRPVHKFHSLDGILFQYLKEIAKLANCESLQKVREYIFKHASTIRRADFVNFRKNRYNVIDNDRFTVEEMNQFKYP